MTLGRLFITAFAFALAALGVRSSGQTQVAVFEQVSVVPMDRERGLADHTVDRAGGPYRGCRRRRRGRRARRRDADRRPRKFLIPALSELHAHLPLSACRPSASSSSTSPTESGRSAACSATRHFALRDARCARRDRGADDVSVGTVVQRADGADAGCRGGARRRAEEGRLRPAEDSSRGAARRLRRAGQDGRRARHSLRRPRARSGRSAARLETKYWTIDHLDGYIEALAKPGAPAGTALRDQPGQQAR